MLPLADNFRHISPYGTIVGKIKYLQLVEANKEQFLGYRFEIQDALYAGNKACVRYSAIKDNFRMEVSEWHYISYGRIEKIVAYYNLEDKANRKLQIDYTK